MTTTLKPVYGASAALTTTGLQSLASDTNLLAGWASAVVDNTANLSVTEKISWVFKMGTTPTVGTNIFIYLWEILDDTPTYPDTIAGTEGTKTLNSTNALNSGAFKLAGVVTIDATTNRLYSGTADVAALFGGHMPKKYGVFVVHNCVVAFFASGNVISRTDITQYQNI